MTQFIIGALRKHGFHPVLAHYEPYKSSPHLSVPSYRLLLRKPGCEQRITLDGCETHAIGAWLPELEITQHLATDNWRRLIESAQFHLTVSGSVLASLQYYQTGTPFLGWIASGWEDDRIQRVREYPFSRRVLDRAFVVHIARALERATIRSGDILAISAYTQRTLNRIAQGPAVKDVLPQPVDTELFSPNPELHVCGRVGFSARLSDPRKNIDLFLEALSLLIRNGREISGLVVGGEPDATLSARVAELGISNHIEFVPTLDHAAFRERLRTFDVYVVPSWQEGLCITALEAMACGVPVVSTRCGGPEEYVLDGRTGRLVGFDASEMADAIMSIVGDRKQRDRLAAGARDLVLTCYSHARAERIFWNAFGNCFPGATM